MCILARTGAREIVEHQDVAAARSAGGYHIAADEPGSAGNQNRPLAAEPVADQRHATSPLRSSSLAACSTLSSATCPESHSASSARPSSNFVRGSKPSSLRL